MRPIVKFLIGLAVLGAIGAGLVSFALRGRVAGQLRRGQPVPDFRLTSLDGQVWSLADLAGRPAMLRFSSRTCVYCMDDFADLRQYQLRYPSVQVLAIEINSDPSLVRMALGNRPTGYPILLDPDGQAAAAYKLRGLPMFFFIDGSGRLVATVWGDPGVVGRYIDNYLRSLSD